MAAAAWFGGWVALVAGGALAVDANKQKIKQRRRAQADYNASLKDRLEMVDLQPQAPRTLVLGRVRYVEGVRRKWTSGANEQRLTMIVSLAGHEIDAVETVYFDDVALTLDGSGYVTTAPYYKGRTTLGQAIFTVTGGVGSVDVAPNVPIGATALAIKDVEAPAPTVSCTISGTVISCTGAPSDGSYFVNYEYTTGASLARVRAYLGAAGQNVGAALAAEYPGKITSADKFDGIALLVVDIDYDTDVFPQGRPNVTALIRGAKCYNPATTLTVWTENPALHALKYATWASGWNLQSGDYSTADIIAAATVCDVSTSFPLSTGSVTLPRYRCGITITADADPAEAMDSIMETMAGRHGWSGGVWRLRAGTLKSTATTMDQTWLVNDNVGGRPNTEPVISAVQAVPRAQQINRVTGACVDPAQRYQVLPFPAVEDSVLVAAHGTRALDVEYPGVNSIAHAQHLASMTIRQAQAGLRLEVVCDVRAGVLELFDVVALTMPRYGFSSKLFEVIGWTWTQTGAYRLTLAEITAAMFTVESALTGRDPAPDSDLPAPWEVETITGLAVTSGTEALTDGSVLTRTKVSWDAATKQAIIQGGTIEVQYTLASEASADAWPSWVEQGASTSTTIPGLMSQSYYVFRARAVQTQPLVRGNWSTSVAHQIADVPAVSGLVAQTVSLSGTGFAFVFADENASTADYPASVVFTATLQNLTGTVTFSATAYDSGGGVVGTEGGVTLTSVTATSATLTKANFVAPGSTVRYVIVTASIASTNGTGTLTDKMTIYRGDDGSSAVQAMLTNEAHTLPTTSDGVVSYAGSGTTIRVFEGTTELDYDGVGTAAGKWTASRSVTLGTLSAPGALSESGLTAVMANHDSMITDTAQVSVVITGKTLTGASFPTITKIQSLAKSWQGEQGVPGDQGDAGIEAQTLTLGASAFAFVFADENATAADYPSSVTFTASLQNVTGTVDFAGTAYDAAGTVVGSEGGVSLGGSGLSRSLSKAAFVAPGTTVAYVIVTASIASTNGTGTLTDTFTVYRGNDGSSAVQAVLSNDAHTIPTDSAGNNGVYTGSGSTIRVFEGTTELDYDGAGATAGKWTATRSASGITAGAITESGLTGVMAQHSAMTADTATVTISITGKTLSGGAFSLTKLQTLSKSKSGTGGARGSARVYWPANDDFQRYPTRVSPKAKWARLGTLTGTNDTEAQDFDADAESYLLGEVGASALVVGDELTATNVAGTASATGWWDGTQWVDPGVVIDGNLLVEGTVTALAVNAVYTLAIKGDAVTVPRASTSDISDVTVTATTEAGAHEVISQTFVVPAESSGEDSLPNSRLITGAIATIDAGSAGSGTGVMVIERVLSGTRTTLFQVGFSYDSQKPMVVTIPVSDAATLTYNATYTYAIRIFKNSGGGALVVGGASISILGTKGR